MEAAAATGRQLCRRRRPGIGPAGQSRPKLGSCAKLRALVSGPAQLTINSPEQISGWLRRLHPDNEAMQLSHETIYRSLYVQSQRIAARRELTRHLRSGRAKRRPRGSSRQGEGRGRIREMVMISERPPRWQIGRSRATGRETC